MAQLTRYELHVEGKFLQGAVLAGTYSQENWESVCDKAGVDIESVVSDLKQCLKESEGLERESILLVPTHTKLVLSSETILLKGVQLVKFLGQGSLHTIIFIKVEEDKEIYSISYWD